MKVHTLVVPYDSGFRETRMGAGPGRLLDEGLLGALAPGIEVSLEHFEAATDRLRGEVASAVEIAQWLAGRVSAARRNGVFPLVIAGNCMSALGTVAGLQARSRRVPGVCWFDAHADFNTPETTESGFLDGMALAVLTGRCWPKLSQRIPDFRPIPDDQVLLFGARNLDGAERKALESSEIHWMKSVGDSLLATDKLRGLRDRFGEVYLHVDLDVLDASEGRANMYASAGGFTRERLFELVDEITASFHIGAAAITAYDPECDPDGRIAAIATQLVSRVSRAMQ